MAILSAALKDAFSSRANACDEQVHLSVYTAIVRWKVGAAPDMMQDMNVILIVLVLLLLFGGGGFYIGGPAVGGGGLGLILLICLIIYLMGGFRSRG